MDHLVQLSLTLTFAIFSPLLATGAEPAAQPLRERTISPRLAEILAATLPKFEPALAANPVAPEQANFSVVSIKLSSGDPGAADIVRLPDFIVVGQKPPSPVDVMTKTERDKFMMRKYLGEEQGLNRALNMLTAVDLWRKIPVLRRYPFVVGQSSGRGAHIHYVPHTNAERGAAIYEREKHAEKMEELSSLLSSQPKSSAPASAKK